MLHKFSANITEKSKEIVDKVDNLRFQISEAEVRVHNTFNEFIMLADNQFIENVLI